MSFGTGGIVITDFGRAIDEARALVLLSDGKILLAGKSEDQAALARFDQDGVLDGSFGEGGSVTTLVEGGLTFAPHVVNDLAVQPDGRIVAAISNHPRFVVARYESSGVLDPTFGEAGIARTRPFGNRIGDTVVGLHSGGKIVVAGTTETGFGLVRYLSDGSLDTSFGKGGRVITPLVGRAKVHDLVTQGHHVVVAGVVRIESGKAFALARYRPDGSLDRTFGRAGMVTTSVCGRGSVARALAIDGDGRLVVAGSCDGRDRFALARYTPDGAIDRGFGRNGVVETNVSRFTDMAFSVAIDPVGRIVVAGRTRRVGANWALARYRRNGTLDGAFGEDGLVQLELGSAREGARAVYVQTDGRILAAGTTEGELLDFAVARLVERGDLDPSFGVSGVATADLNGPGEAAAAIALQPDGRIVAAGWARCDLALARYEPSGALDASFGDGGRVITSDGLISAADALVISPDGRLVAIGGGVSDGCGAFSAGFLVARYLSDGSLDSSFGQGGTVRTTEAALLGAAAGVLLPDGRLVVGGDAVSPNSFGVVRYLENGDLDPSFGTGGIVTGAFSEGGGMLRAMVLQPDGRVVAAGWSDAGFSLARYEDDGSLDPTFGDGGTVTTTFTDGQHGASALTIQSDGKLVAAGRTGDGRRCSLALARYAPDGTLDPSFGVDGRVRTSLGPGCERVSEVRVQPDGKIVAVGGAGPFGDEDLVVVRYLSDGTLDASFGIGGVVTTRVSETFDWAFGLALQPDGKIVAAGTGSSPADWVLARYQP